MSSEGKELFSLSTPQSLHSRKYINMGATINTDSLISHSSRAHLSRGCFSLSVAVTDGGQVWIPSLIQKKKKEKVSSSCLDVACEELGNPAGP